MKKNRLEIGVLIVGAIVIIAALMVKFIFNLAPDKSLVLSNIVFSVGFLIYILYSIMSTNNLNRDIRRLNANIDGLKTELKTQKQALEKKKKALDEVTAEKDQLAKESQKLKEEVKDLKQSLADLQSSGNEAKP